MSDQETAPWMIEAAKKINRSLFPGQWPTTVVQKIAEIIAAECTAPAPQLGRCPLCGSDKPDSFLGICAAYNEQNEPAHIFHWASTSDSHRAKMRGLAASPQVTPTPSDVHKGARLRIALDAMVRCSIQGETDECLICGADDDCRHTDDCPVLEAERILNEYPIEGTSEQASPTPDKCPRCGSGFRGVPLIVVATEFFGGQMSTAMRTEMCSDSWHSSAGTPKSRDTGVSLDGGKTIHSKFKND